MQPIRFTLSFILRISLSLPLLLVGSCEQYEYSSPLPGLLEVRLRVANTGPDSLYHPFGQANSFVLTLKELEVYREDGARLPVFANEYAIGRDNLNGDPFNCLDTLARDSAMILGRAFAPPGVFTRIVLRVEPRVSAVIVANEFGPPTIIPVVDALGLNLFSLSIPVAETVEGRLTRITVTLDLDRTLVRGLTTFSYQPYLYVSSVQNF